MKELEFVIPFSPEDRYRHHHFSIKGQIIEYSIQFETFLDGVWYPVVRYDTAYGFSHRDLLDCKGNKRKTPLFITNKNDTLTFAENDIRDNWQVYKQRFLEEAKQWETMI